jgi:electron transfer flavoprotein alpha subunit
VLAVNSIALHAEPSPTGAGERVQLAPPPELDNLRTRYVEALEPPDEGVDLSAAEMIVCVGRGIGGAENIELAEELASALGAELAASRPVVDSGWLPKARQVGKSGAHVTPKLYLALGVSGAPEHVEGMQGAELIVAVNSDPGAAIFNVAHYGAVADLFDVADELTTLIEEG